MELCFYFRVKQMINKGKSRLKHSGKLKECKYSKIDSRYPQSVILYGQHKVHKPVFNNVF